MSATLPAARAAAICPVERGAEGERGNQSQEDPRDGEGDQQ